MIYHLLRLLLKLLSYIPFGMLYALSDGMFYPLYYIVRYRRKIVRRNLTESFPGKSPEEIRRLEKKFYHFFIDMMIESCKLAFMSPEEIKKRMRFVNIELVNSMLRQGRSVSVYIGHYANWEWISTIPLGLEKNTTAIQIYHKLRNPHMERLMKHIRERMGATGVEMHKTARCITELANKRKVSIVGFIADQSPRKKESRYFFNFLNHNTPALTGSEKITKHYDFEAVFLRMKRVKRGYYEAEFIRLHENPKSLPDFELTALYFKQLEQAIVQQPELYLWTHNRFKHAKKE